MKVNLSELLKKGLVEPVGKDPTQAGQLLASARGDLAAAKDILGSGHDGWALAIAYNAMLSAGRALMAKMGYRPSSESHHLAVVKFCAAVLPSEASGLVALFNRYRNRRHSVVYGEEESIGESEARESIVKASEFVGLVAQKLHK